MLSTIYVPAPNDLPLTLRSRSALAHIRYVTQTILIVSILGHPVYSIETFMTAARLILIRHTASSSFAVSSLTDGFSQ